MTFDYGEMNWSRRADPGIVRYMHGGASIPDCTIHTYTAAEAGLFVNSYLLETPTGVVVIDTNLLVADIEALQARLRALRKPLLGIFITHAHPDHFNGVAALIRDREVPVYATANVAKVIREIADAKRAQWGPVYGDQWPADTYYPNTELADGQTLELDGVTVQTRDLGEGESHADSYFVADQRVAFIGDLAFHGTHPYTADGHTTAWLNTLDTLEGELKGLRLLPGHGQPADVDLLTEQRRYLMHYQEVVRRLAPDKKDELTTTMCRFLPDAPLSWMIGLGADAVAAELNQ
jgi:glyoxylase-like metal-dependent hydrolase (beta-lactamase superfamily II)